jgi:hypothetical protein
METVTPQRDRADWRARVFGCEGLDRSTDVCRQVGSDRAEVDYHGMCS